MTQIELAIRTETKGGETYQVIDQAGDFGPDVHWRAVASSDVEGSIEIQATVYNAADLDNLIEQLEQLRGAARQVRKVCGF